MHECTTSEFFLVPSILIATRLWSLATARTERQGREETHVGLEIEVGAPLEEQLHDLRMPFVSSPMQGRIFALRVGKILVSFKLRQEETPHSSKTKVIPNR